MLDVTRATLLFSRGVVLVEGISEQLLVPVLARRLKVNLQDHGVSVISLAGVSFATIAKLFGPGKLRFPVAIITDSDPEVTYENPEKPVRREARPKASSTGAPEPGPRLTKLMAEFEQNDVVRVFPACVTLEYDLAAAGPSNAEVIFDAWASLYASGPKSLTRQQLLAHNNAEHRALALWQAICVGKPSHGKGELAQVLAERLDAASPGDVTSPFCVPKYIEEAICHVAPKAAPDKPDA